MNQTLTVTNHTAQEVAALVQERLASSQPLDAPLEVLPNAIHQEGHWWYIVVPPGRSITNASDYNKRVEKAQRDLRRLDNLFVSILPVMPGWMDIHK